MDEAKKREEDRLTIKLYQQRYEVDQKMLARAERVHDEKNKLIKELLEIVAEDARYSYMHRRMLQALHRTAERTGPTVTEW